MCKLLGRLQPSSHNVIPFILLMVGCMWWHLAPMLTTKNFGHEGGMHGLTLNKVFWSNDRLCCIDVVV